MPGHQRRGSKQSVKRQPSRTKGRGRTTRDGSGRFTPTPKPTLRRRSSGTAQRRDDPPRLGSSRAATARRGARDEGMPEYRRGEDGMQLGRSDDPRHRHDDRYRDQHGRRSDGGERQRDENARSDQGRHSGNEPYGDARYGDRRYGEERYGGERYRDERDSDYRYDLPRDEGRSDDRDRNYAEGRSDDGNAAARRYDALGYGEGRGRERDDMSWNRGRYTDTGEYENAQFAEDLNRYEGGPRRRIDDRDTRGPSKR